MAKSIHLFFWTTWETEGEDGEDLSKLIALTGFQTRPFITILMVSLCMKFQPATTVLTRFEPKKKK